MTTVSCQPDCRCSNLGSWRKSRAEHYWGDPGRYTLLQPYHEADGEDVGHLRVASKPIMIVNGFIMPIREDGEVRDFKLESRPIQEPKG